MKTSFVSSLTIQNAMRLTIQQAQTELIKVQEEATTGRYADIGVALGAGATRSLDLNREVQRLTSLKSTNSIVTQRLSASQEALTQIANAAQASQKALIVLSGNNSTDQLDIAKTEILNSLSIFTSAANTSFSGEYIFSGINSDVKPLADYNTNPASPAKAAFNTALTTYMGANGITSMGDFTVAEMTDFITNVVEPMYTGTGWDTDWSNASDQNMTSRISTTEVVQSSTNANSDGMRKFALASIVATELFGSGISADVRSYVGQASISYMGSAISGIDADRSKLGISEARVKKADTSIEAQIKIVKLHVGDLEGVDAYEATTRMKSLLAQVETSYTLTSRLQQLSLVNFL
ncbi:flagellar hook-associated family protein [Pararhizobium sp.]|uniref:flagellar hook-associated family protein n=1 Tax=Pararhizobium sp. TaxID=1977563 RepID=UPI0027280339|nr:flagellar hook-associated family protein [Pararhizobium sp.]MDO9418252.1 flagellar hook-associated family protein [Pararhizobium sp.]